MYNEPLQKIRHREYYQRNYTIILDDLYYIVLYRERQVHNNGRCFH